MILAILGAIWLATLALLWQRERAGRAGPVAMADVLAGGALALLTLGFFWRTISGDVFQPADGGDLVSFLYPTYRFAASQIQQGALPLWNPTLYGGAPFISDIQAGFLYPPNLLLFLLNPDFDYRTMQWLSIGHLYWAGLGVYVLLRTLHFDAGRGTALGDETRPVIRLAALFGALAFQFSDPLLIHLGNLNLIAVLSWLPWTLAAFHRALATGTHPDGTWRRGLCWVSITGVIFAVGTYAGHAQSTVYGGMALGVYALVSALVGSRGGVTHSRLRLRSSVPLLYLLAVGVLTALLTAPLLLPAAQLTQFTERANLTYQETVGFSLAPTQLIGLLTPSFFGRGPALHWGLWQRVELPYAGVATLIFAVAALLGGRTASLGSRRRLLPWLALAATGLLVGFGLYAILHGWLTLLPVFGQFRAPARALVLWTLAVSVLGAVGLDQLSVSGKQSPSISGQPPVRATQSTQLPITNYQLSIANFLRWGGFLLIGAWTPLMYLALLLTQADETAFLRASVATLAVTVATVLWGATWALVGARRAGWIGGNALAALAVALLFVDLSATGAYTDISEADPARNFEQTEIVDFLRAQDGLFRVDSRTDIDDLWQPDAAALHGLQDVGGIANPLMLAHWAALWEATGGRDSQLYDLLNVRYVIARDGTPLPDGFGLALDAPGELSVYEHDNPLPRVWIAHGARVVDDFATALATLRAEDFSPGTEVVLLDAPNVAPTNASGSGAATLAHYGSSELTVQVETDAPGYLVLSEIWFPGWRATVNGERVDVLRANGALRAVAVPSGESTVRLWFAPAGWRWGLAAFGTGVLWVLLSFAPWRRGD